MTEFLVGIGLGTIFGYYLWNWWWTKRLNWELISHIDQLQAEVRHPGKYGVQCLACGTFFWGDTTADAEGQYIAGTCCEARRNPGEGVAEGGLES